MSDDIDLYADNTDEEFSQDGTGNDVVDLYDDVLGTASDSLNPKHTSRSSEQTDPDKGSNDIGTERIVPPVGVQANYTGKKFPIIVGNMTWWTTDQDLTDVITALGVKDILEVKFFDNRVNGQSRGFAIVSLGSYASSKLVIEKMTNMDLDGHKITVTTCNRVNLQHFQQHAPGTGREVREKGSKVMPVGGKDEQSKSNVGMKLNSQKNMSSGPVPSTIAPPNTSLGPAGPHQRIARVPPPGVLFRPNQPPPQNSQPVPSIPSNTNMMLRLPPGVTALTGSSHVNVQSHPGGPPGAGPGVQNIMNGPRSASTPGAPGGFLNSGPPGGPPSMNQSTLGIPGSSSLVSMHVVPPRGIQGMPRGVQGVSDFPPPVSMSLGARMPPSISMNVPPPGAVPPGVMLGSNTNVSLGMRVATSSVPPNIASGVHVNPAFLPNSDISSGLPPGYTSSHTTKTTLSSTGFLSMSAGSAMPHAFQMDQFGRPVRMQSNDPGLSYAHNLPPQDTKNAVSQGNLSAGDPHFEECLNTNKTVCSSAITRAVQDASDGDFAAAIETLATAISLIKQSKVADDDRSKLLISSLQDTLHGFERQAYSSSRGRRSRSRDGDDRRRSRERRRRDRSRSRDRDDRYRSDSDYDSRYEPRYRDSDRHRDRDRERDRDYRMSRH